MKLTCPSCKRQIDTGSDSWPGDLLTCPHCGGQVPALQADTALIQPSDPGDTPSLVGDSGDRPLKIEPGKELTVGTLIGQYRIESLIGSGGMGSVYKALHLLLNRPVALKILPPDLASDPEFIARFKREAMALAKLQHPNIVAVHDMGIQGEIYFFTMEFVEGVNLRHLLTQGKLSPEKALQIVPHLCAALEYAHQQGIVHRDIKPENIMLDKDGVPKIADFGLAKILRGDTGRPALTQSSVVMGTIDYMAPEQRASSKLADHRADIYSLGVVLYEMLTGDLPVGKFDPPSRKVEVDVRLDDVVLKALENDPDRRYQRASRMGTDVDRIRSGPAPAPVAPPPQKKSKQQWFWILGGLLIAFAFMRGFGTWEIVILAVAGSIVYCTYRCISAFLRHKSAGVGAAIGCGALCLLGCGVLLVTFFLAGAVRHESIQAPSLAFVSAQEDQAISSLRRIAEAEELFRKLDLDRNEKQDYWTGDVAGLHHIDGGKAKLIDEELANADGAPGLARTYEGLDLDKDGKPDVTYQGTNHRVDSRAKYVFRMMMMDESGLLYGQDVDGRGFACQNLTGYAVVAYPVNSSLGGHTFIMNQDRTIYRNNTHGRPVLAWPPAPKLASEWTQMDN